MSKHFSKSTLQSWNSLSPSKKRPYLPEPRPAFCTPIYQADRDFSFMPDDVFTRIVKKTHFEYFVEGSGKEAEIYFDRNEAQEMVRRFWLGKSANDMVKLLSDKQGSCRRIRPRRYWRYQRKTMDQGDEQGMV